MLKLIYTTEDRIHLYHLRNLLESEGIACVIKNDHLSSLVGEIPSTSCWPEIWVEPVYMLAAQRILKNVNLVNHDKHEEDWVCESCGERHSAQFVECWKCQGQAEDMDVILPF